MTACKDSLSGKKAVSATLAGVLAVGMVPAAAFAADADQPETGDIELQDVVAPVTDFNGGTVTAAKDAKGNSIDVTDAAFTLGEKNLGIVATEVTTESGVKVNLADTDTEVKYIAADKKGKLPSDVSTATEDFPATAGTYYAIVKVTDSQSDYVGGQVALKFTVAAKSLAAATAYEVNADDEKDLSDTTFTYNGTELKVGFELDGKALVEGTDYTVKFYTPKTSKVVTVENAGTYTAVVTGIGNYAGSKASVDITVDALDLSAANIVLESPEASAVAKDLETATIKTVNGKAPSANLAAAISAKFAEGPEGTVIETSANGSYTYTLSPVKDNKNVTGTATVSVDKVASTSVDWAYGDAALDDMEIDHSKAEGDAGYVADFDVDKVVAKGAGDKLAYTYKVTDADGNEAAIADVKTAGTWFIDFTVDAKANGYDFGGTKTVKIVVTEGTIEGDADVFVKQDGKLVTAPSFTYDGTNALSKLDITVKSGDKVLAEGADYTLEVKDAEGKQVDGAVDAGTYTVTVASDSYDVDNADFTLVVKQLDVSKIRVANQIKIDGKSFLPYTGEDITPVVEYLMNPDETDPEEQVWAELSADLYTASYKFIKSASVKAEDVDAINVVGQYAITLKAADKNIEKNYFFGNDGTTSVDVYVSDYKYFHDVAVTDWFYKVVYEAQDLDYMHGYADTDFFGPNDSITRGQVAVVLYNMAGGYDHDLNYGDDSYNSVIGYKSFDDVDGKMYYGKAIAWAKQTGIANGYGDGTFKPDNAITREEFAVMLSNYAKKMGNFVASDGKALADLPDASGVSDWAKEAVAWAVEEGYMGTAGFVNAGADITRAETAAMAVRYQPEAL